MIWLLVLLLLAGLLFCYLFICLWLVLYHLLLFVGLTLFAVGCVTVLLCVVCFLFVYGLVDWSCLVAVWFDVVFCFLCVWYLLISCARVWCCGLVFAFAMFC